MVTIEAEAVKGRYRKRPVVIEAVRWEEGLYFDSTPGWLVEAIGKHPDSVGGVFRMGNVIHVFTLEGTMIANPGDWIIRGIKGELYPCKDEIFRMTYEPAGVRSDDPAKGLVEALTSLIDLCDNPAVNDAIERIGANAISHHRRAAVIKAHAALAAHKQAAAR